MRSRLGIYAQQRPPFEVPALTGGQASSGHHPRDGISLFVTRRELQQCHSTGQQVPEDGRQAFSGHRQTIRTTVDRAHRILRKLLGLFMRHPRGIGDDQREPLVCAQHVRRPASPAVDPQARSPGVARGVLGGRRVDVDADEAPARVGHANKPIWPAPLHNSRTSPGGRFGNSEAAHRDCACVHGRGLSNRESNVICRPPNSTVVISG